MVPLRSVLPDVAVAVAAIAVGAALLPWPASGEAAVLAVLATVIAGVDRRIFVIPDTANLVLVLCGLAVAVAGLPAADRTMALAEAIARGLLAGGLFWGLRALHFRWRGAEGLGLGDVKLAAAGAPWLAWSSLVPVLELAVLGALVAIVVETGLRRRSPRLDDMVPFGVFLAPALWMGFVAERIGLIDRLWPFVA